MQDPRAANSEQCQAGQTVQDQANSCSRPDRDPNLKATVELVREISTQTDPQQMVQVFRKHTPRLYGGESSISISRRGLHAPQYRVTRSTRWTEDINPWKQPDRLPMFRGGLLADLLYADEPRVMRNVSVHADEPAYEYLKDARSIVALPMYDSGESLNMVVRMSIDPAGFDQIDLADAVLTANLFGRATNNLLVAQRLREAYAQLDHEMRRVAALQRSLLPIRLPSIPTLDIAASYATAARAGGDYYDFFDLGDGRWGIWLADVSGHGTPAAVIMAMLRTMLHARCNQVGEPRDLLRIVNRHLCDQSSRYQGIFATAFYAMYDPSDRTLRYSSAGHNPALLVDRHAHVAELDDAQTLPMGVEYLCEFPESSVTLSGGDTLLMYTDGIIEASNPAGEFYGRDRLLGCIREDLTGAQHIVDCVNSKLLGFMDNGPQVDDQTLVAMRVLH
ncbi:MAG: PP2C family protein-serine/threonine phosphatase [Planctomycetes bacterium]|nr:PP2C family protein-serine/threonine phosphatase [Planctomycetota bacterium]MBI3832748.1 PP2C family protein-serine/threonine phosphatase [Planctomycetota bacterium]